MVKKSTHTSPPGKSRKREILGIVIIFLSIIVLISLLTYRPGDWPGSSRSFDEPAQNWIGNYGAGISHVLFERIGYTGYFLVFFTLIFGGVVFLHKSYRYLIKPSILLTANGIFLPLIASLTADIGSDSTIPSSGPGGMFGTLFAHLLVSYIGRTGSYLISLAAILVSVVLTTSLKPSTVVEHIINMIRSLEEMTKSPQLKPEKSSKKASGKSDEIVQEEIEGRLPEKPVDESPFLTPVEDEVREESSTPYREPTIVDYDPKLKTPAIEIPGEEKEISGEYDEDEDYSLESAGDYSEYVLPGTDLLDEPLDNAPIESREEMLDKAQHIMDSLRHFNIESEVRQITPGPIVTRYELTLAPGIKVGRIVGLSDDLAMTLKARGGIRILVPIPGKAAIGIEVPNGTRSIVYFREIAESESFAEADGPLTFAIGKTTSGDSVVADLGKMPHLLIAGSTGSGKSVCINALIASILMKASPDRVRMIMIDPKVVELNI